VAVSLAASLCVMAARLSTKQIPDAPEIAATAESLRDRASSLCQADADAYSLVMSAKRRPREPDPDERSRQIAAALSVAADVPLEVVQIAARVADVAVRIAEGGNPNLLGDAVTAAVLADAGARAAAALVLINLQGPEEDDRLSQVEVLLEETASSAARARRRLKN